TPYEQGHIRDGLRLNQRRRLHTELAELGIAMRAQGNKLSPAQTAEKDEIIADAGNWVAGWRAGSGAGPSPVIDEQFRRLKDLLEDVCSDGNFAPDLFAAIAARCRSDRGTASQRHGRTRSGHPRLWRCKAAKTWMPGIKPGRQGRA